ncbi:DUF6804 family protein [Flavobacterium flabelliforme]|nr:DUF6804 family protein [Flavobacterium flabelliforme]
MYLEKEDIDTVSKIDELVNNYLKFILSPQFEHINVNNQKMNNSIIKLALANLLLLCLINMPYGFYQFVRFTAMVGFAYLAYSANEQNKKNQLFIYIALALLFQPFFKIALGRSLWNIVDVIISVSLVISVIKESKIKL